LARIYDNQKTDGRRGSAYLKAENLKQKQKCELVIVLNIDIKALSREHWRRPVVNVLCNYVLFIKVHIL